MLSEFWNSQISILVSASKIQFQPGSILNKWKVVINLTYWVKSNWFSSVHVFIIYLRAGVLRVYSSSYSDVLILMLELCSLPLSQGDYAPSLKVCHPGGRVKGGPNHPQEHHHHITGHAGTWWGMTGGADALQQQVDLRGFFFLIGGNTPVFPPQGPQ